MMNFQPTGNKYSENDTIALLKALKFNIMQDLHVADIGRVTAISSNKYKVKSLNDSNIQYECYCLKSPIFDYEYQYKDQYDDDQDCTLKEVTLNVKVGDYVLVLFCDTNVITNLNRISSNLNPMDVVSNYHERSHGVIIGKLK